MTKQPETIGLTELLALSEDARLGRAADALEKIAAAAPQIERIADAMETFVALFASVIGQAYAWCPGEAEASPVVNYIRSGTGESFKCDKTDANDDE
ncbi:hypothetical protein SAMN05216330_102105 [Bradyrhizobium sp. Ghvi]|uniref:hypothetical protein n=1 Tax=Bradyrhizobium sp. Ghvi TaxID=1855319 RepID=UPI0008E529A2|nr:hypothetical protein [Bradyrhizobium sp. Ghvi]SFO17996.1 hypothetical protein SAMN05216330_102105 [Bradyrhizobium sp. Ghvi]